MRSRDEEREEQRRYEGDVEYDVWRQGGNPDLVSYDRVMDGYYDGKEAEAVARSELMRQRPKPEQMPTQEPDEQYPDEQFPDEEAAKCSPT